MRNNLMLLILVAGVWCCRSEKEASTSPRKGVIIAYVPGFRGELDEKTIDAKKISHINYAFVDVKDSMAWLTNMSTDTVNFRKLNLLKKDNPDLKILISIGGWSWSNNFSDAVLTESSRKKFAYTSAAIVDRYGLDGVDIDWEYPGFRGEDNVFRPEDRQNFTLMFRALRQSLDTLGARTGKKYLLTTAVPEFTAFLEKTDMDQAAAYMDFVNLMAYDFHVRAGDTVGHHSNLYPTRDGRRSAHRGVTEYVNSGVPIGKIVLGIPFYGRSWIMATLDNRGIDRMADSVVRAGGYTYIRDSLASRPGFKRYWDDDAKAPYLFNETTRQLVVFDDEQSVRIKCEYVNENNLAGVMFWEYSSDPGLYLLDAINTHLK